MRFYAIAILPAILAPVFAAVQTVSIKNLRFTPSQVVINPGDEIIWTNNDRVPHTATADGGSFDSGIIAPGESFSQTFATADTVPYHCTIHPFMMGKIAAAGNTTSTATVTTGPATATVTTGPATATVTTSTVPATVITGPATVTTGSATATVITFTATVTLTTAMPTTTNKPSSGNILKAPIKVILSIGGVVAALAQFL